MDCDACGRYRPSAEIAPLREAGGRLLMACVRCRRLAVGHRERATPVAEPTATVAVVSAVAASMR